MIPAPFFFGWAIALYFALASLLRWKYRRTKAERRISRGLRTYTATGAAIAVFPHS